MRHDASTPALAFFRVGLRPFFLASGLWAALALALWLGILNGVVHLPTRFDPISWHVHAMLFGFVLATIGGFLLTAIPSWTGRAPIGGGWVAALLALWGLGRLASLISALLPEWLAAILDLAYPLALTLMAAHEIIASRNRKSAPVIGPLTLFVIADLLMQLPLAGVRVPPALGWRLAVAAALLLISVVGGRIVPAFTRNWLSKRGGKRLPVLWGPVDVIAVGLLFLGLIGWAVAPEERPLGYLLILAGLANVWRLTRWRGELTHAEPLLLILHIAYGWLCLGAVLLGVALLTPAMPLAGAIHALTVGAIGTMTLAVMTRSSLGHTGHALTAGPLTVMIYLLVGLAAIVRIAAAFPTPASSALLIAAGLLWIAAFLSFGVIYGWMLIEGRRTSR